MEQELIGRVNLLMEAMGFTTPLRTVDDVRHVCSR